MRLTPTLQAALEYHELGWVVLPTRVGEKRPSLPTWKEFQSGRRPTVTELHEWFGGQEDHGVYLVCGTPSRVAVLDCDTPAAVEYWKEKIPGLWGVPHVKTSKGFHFFWSIDGPVPSARQAGEWDFQGEGKGLVLPPSQHASGHFYTWLKRPNGALPPLPAALEHSEARETRPEGQETASAVSQGGRNDTLTKMAGHLRREGYGPAEIEAALWALNTKAYDPPLPRNEVRTIAHSIGNRPDKFRQEFDKEMMRQEVRDQVRIARAESEYKTPPESITVREAREKEYPPLEFTVDELMSYESNTLLIAQFKTGKTTNIVNLCAALVDGGLYLGKFKCALKEGNVGVWNCEMSERQLMEWMIKRPMKRDDRVHVCHLKGHPVPLISPAGKRWAIQWLRDHNVKFWIVDPWALLLGWSGLEENSNTDAILMTAILDEIKQEAGVPDLVVVAHTGRNVIEGSEHARGATRLDDWADARWLLASDNASDSDKDVFFKAHGRDVAVTDGKLTFDKVTWQLTYDATDRKKSRAVKQEENQEARTGTLRNTVLMVIRQEPGITTRALRAKTGGNNEALARMVDVLEEEGKIKVEPGIKNGGKTQFHYPSEDPS